MLIPNVIIAGAPKCGTTSLFNWLSANPDVCASSVKETRFFIDEAYPLRLFGPTYHSSGLSAYSHYFPDYRLGTHKVALEATPDYMYQTTALELIPKLSRVPKLIFLLRKPSDRIYSLYRFAQNNTAVLDRRIQFDAYVSMLFSSVGSIQTNEILRLALEHSKYINYLRRWEKSVGKQNLIILLFEEMKADPLPFMRNVASMLGINDAFYEIYTFPVSNETFLVRSQFIHRWIRRTKRKIPAAVKRLAGTVRRSYYHLNTLKENKMLTDTELSALDELDRYFIPYNQELERAYHLNLKYWSPKASRS